MAGAEWLSGAEAEIDVLVVGAGPVGLLLATELSRDGVRVLLIDRMKERSFFCKALGVTARTLEIFADLGIAQDAIDAGTWIAGVSSFDDGVAGAAMDIPPGLPFGSLSLAQFETERLLEACLHRHGGAVAYGATLASFVAAENCVRARILGPSETERTIHCRWLVGCDGAHSIVRSGLGLAFEGGHYPQTFILADLELTWDLPRGRLYRFNHASGDGKGTSLVAVPVAGSARRYRLSTILPDDAPSAGTGGETPAPPSLEQISGLMLPLLPEGTKFLGLHWSSIYRVSHRIVPRYAQRRVFLAGDAAHIHPPVGGQGMNTGLQDAHNLAWKLALASRGLAVPGLLDSYSEERRAVGLDVVENTSRALNEALARRSPLPGMRETQLLISYQGSSILHHGQPALTKNGLAAGDRVPDAGPLRRRYVGQPFRLHERLGRGRHILMAYLDDDALIEKFAEMLALLRASLGQAGAGFVIAPQGAALADHETVPVLSDAAGAFATELGAAPGMTWLVRPDGYFSWISASPSVVELKQALSLVTNIDAKVGGEVLRPS